MAFKRHHFQPDTPTNVFATLNPLDGQYQSYYDISGGNLKFTNSSTANTIDFSNYLVSSIFFGMDTSFYFEVNMPEKGESSGNFFGIFQKETIDSSLQYGRIQATSGNHNAVYQWANGGIVRINSSGATTYSVSSPTTSTVIGAFYNASDRTFSYYHDGILHQSVDISMFNDAYTLRPVFNSYLGEVRINFGQDHTFDGIKTDSDGYADANGQGQFYCQPPAGALALCTENLPVTPITAHLGEKPVDYFKAVTYTGNDGTKSIDNVGFQPDFVWIKGKKLGGYYHVLNDSVRGAGRSLFTNNKRQENGENGTEYSVGDLFSSFDKNGFTVNANVNASTNGSSQDYVAWSWKAGGSAGRYNVDGRAYNSAVNAGLTDGSILPTGASVNTKAGFSIIRYTGDGQKTATVPHGLSGNLDFIITKDINREEDFWHADHISLPSNANLFPNNTWKIYENSHDGWVMGTKQDNVIAFGSGEGNTGTNVNAVNEDGVDVICYCWKAVPGYSAFGSYIGNELADGPFVYTGFKPAFILLKCSSHGGGSADNWILLDNAINPVNKETSDVLYADTTGELNLSGDGYNSTDDTGIDNFDLLSNGFKVTSINGRTNMPGREYIYMAFAEKPETPASRVTITKPDIQVNQMRSMYFDGSSNYLSRTSQGGDRRTWTWSSWIKMERSLSGGRTLFHQYDGNAGNRCLMGFSGHTFQANSGGSGGQINMIVTNRKFQDYTGWHHFHVANDTTQSEATQRIRLWVDGIEIHDTKTPADQNTEGLGNSSNTMEIGYLVGGWFPGHMSNIYFIDGQALEPSALTETVNGVLIPKQYEGEYGTNGFHLDFAPENMEYDGDKIIRVLDESPNSNHWTAH